MAIDVSPRFTVSLRGYDKDEVEHYLESVSERSSQTDDQLFEMQEQSRFLEDENERLAGRVGELEAAIRSETPHSVSALGERITLILTEAEEGASDTLTQAKAQAEYLVSEAQKEADALRRQASASAAQAAETLTGAQRQAEELAERLEAEARARAATVLGDAELRAQRRQEQIEGWAQQVITRTQAEQARLVDEFAMVRRRHDAEVRALLGERDDAVAALRSLQTSLGRAVDRLPAGRSVRPDGDTGTGGARAAVPGTETLAGDDGVASPAASTTEWGAAAGTVVPGAGTVTDAAAAGTTDPAAGATADPGTTPAATSAVTETDARADGAATTTAATTDAATTATTDAATAAAAAGTTDAATAAAGTTTAATTTAAPAVTAGPAPAPGSGSRLPLASFYAGRNEGVRRHGPSSSSSSSSDGAAPTGAARPTTGFSFYDDESATSRPDADSGDLTD